MITDHTDHEWPREIWAFAIDHTKYEMSGTYVTSEFATAPRWEGDKERERPVQCYVDADIYDSADRYWRERCEAQAARIAELEARANITPNQFHEAMVAADKLGYHRAIRDAVAWQPIETAPRDGFHVLLYRPDIQFVGYWADAGWCMQGCKPIDPPPTHWKPLPPAPQEGE